MKKKVTFKLFACLFGLFMTAGVVATTASSNTLPVNAEDVNNGGTRWFTALGDGELKTYNNPPEGQTKGGFWAEYTPAQGEDSVEIFYNAAIKEFAGENYTYVVSSGSAKAVVMTYTQYQAGWEGAAGTTVSLIYMKRPDGKTYATVSLTPDLEFDYENGYAYIAGTNQKTVGWDGTTHSETGTVCDSAMSPFTGKKYIKYKMLNHSTKGPLIGIGNYGGTHVAYFTDSDTLETDFLEKATANLPEDSKYRDIYAKMTPELAVGLFSTATSGTYRRARQKQSLAFYGMDTTDTISYCYTYLGGVNYESKTDVYVTDDEVEKSDAAGPINIQKTKTLNIGTTYTFNDLAIRATSIRYSAITSGTNATVALDGNDYSKSDYYWGVYTSASSVSTATKTGSDYASSDTSSNVLGGTDTNWSFTPTADDAGKTYYLLVNSTKYPNVTYARGGANADLFLFTVPEISYENADGEEVKASVTTDENGKVTLGEPTSAAPAGKTFIGWKKVTEGIYADRLYSANSVVTPTQNETYVAQYATFTRLAGAEIRLANPNGIRWVAEFDKAEFDALAGEEANYTYGAIITSENSDKSVDIVGDKEKLIAGEDKYTMYFALTGIKEANYARKYYVAPYVTFTYFDGTTMTVKAGLAADATQDWSTYKGIVNAAYGDVASEKDETLGYVYEVEIGGEKKYTRLNPTLWANLVEVYNAVNAQ